MPHSLFLLLEHLNNLSSLIARLCASEAQWGSGICFRQQSLASLYLYFHYHLANERSNHMQVHCLGLLTVTAINCWSSEPCQVLECIGTKIYVSCKAVQETMKTKVTLAMPCNQSNYIFLLSDSGIKR